MRPLTSSRCLAYPPPSGCTDPNAEFCCTHLSFPIFPNPGARHCYIDNLKVHSSQKVIEYLESNPGRFEFVFTPKHASWLNLVEGFFSKMTKQMLRGIRVTSKRELENRIYKYFDEINADPVVYHWSWNLDDVDSDEDVKVQTLI